MKIYCVNNQQYVEVRGGETLLEIAARLEPQLPFRPICAYVNYKTEDLGYPVFMPKMVEYLDASSPSGRRVYTRSLCMTLYKALRDTLPGRRLSVDHSIAGGVYCRVLDNEGNTVAPAPETVGALEEAMRRLVAANLPFVRKERLTKDVVEKFRSQNMPDKVLLLETTHDLYTTYYKLGDTVDSYYSSLAPSTGYLEHFRLVPYEEGMLLMTPGSDNRDVPRQPATQKKMYKAFTDYQRFNRVIKVSNVGELNRTVANRQTSDLITLAETMHSKIIGGISDSIAERHRHGAARVVTLAGPSSSGKTTTCKRLAVQLMTNLLTPKMISLDDYFLDRSRTPRDTDGDYDYESLYALDLERLNDDLRRLLAGEEINLPTYSFELGQRIERRKPLRLADNEILLVEGIHGLNPELMRSLPDDAVFKVYVSALTTLSIDDHNWIPTTDNRLLRRIVRDFKYRHTGALETIRRWPSVRRGEEKWIFPFQENADATFNSSLIFELGVMRDYAVPILRSVPHDVPEYTEASRLIRFLSYFEPIPADQVPATSLLREFLGGSAFRY